MQSAQQYRLFSFRSEAPKAQTKLIELRIGNVRIRTAFTLSITDDVCEKLLFEIIESFGETVLYSITWFIPAQQNFKLFKINCF